MAVRSVLKTAEEVKEMTNAELLAQQRKMKSARQSLQAELTAIRYRLNDIETQQDLIIAEQKRRGIWI